ncbi:hypothetical protein N0V84_005052 [Fusarium piperis]|uniref:Peptidase S33 tripeptidyl aminopeptidase-like C-terminal domain-containing protein n=1 Tax=Fusarium piperis TaxID=1435070 RepID=A0A9W8WEP6_9HYPO|nr:hypothetical protein N0V84_005052 [Fusarium piperis]
MRSILCLTVASLAAAMKVPLPWAALNTHGLSWGRCSYKLPPNVECAEMEVPLDYTDPASNQTLIMDIVRYAALKKPLKGSIIINFGRLGAMNVPKLMKASRRFAWITNRQWDLVTWNIRGTGRSIPFDCSNPTVPGAAPPRRGRNNHHLNNTWSQEWAEGAKLADDCHLHYPEYGTMLGMSFQARDLIQLVDALQEDGMLRYWGFSTGAILGATAAAMFPDRVDKVLLDGVRNVHEYYHSFGDPTLLDNLDNTFHAFLKGCVASPHNCALARAYRTVDNIKFLMKELYKELDAAPREINGVIFDSHRVQAYLHRSLYHPRNYASLAKTLDRLVTGDMEALKDVESTTRKWLRKSDITFGVRCGDNIQRARTLQDFEPVMDELRGKTEWFPRLAENIMQATCVQWPFQAKELYDGDFNVTTRNPVLIINNEWDPVTPWAGAQNLSESFNNSVAVRYKAFGHTTVAQNSDCIWDIINNYFMSGEVPPPDTVCDPNEHIFSNMTDFGRAFGPDAQASLDKLWRVREKLGYCDLH